MCHFSKGFVPPLPGRYALLRLFVGGNGIMLWGEKILYVKTASNAIAGFLVRPGRFFSGASKVRKTAPEKRIISYVMRNFVMDFVTAAIWQPCFAFSFFPYTPSHN